MESPNEKDTKADSNGLIWQLMHFIEETDIRFLVYVPPLLGIVGFVISLFIASLIANGRPNQAFIDIALGILFLTFLIPGFAEIYKREMPGSFGKVIKGKYAVVSGAIYIVVFGLGSIVAFLSGFNSIFSK